MCHDLYFTREGLEEEITHELLDEPADRDDGDDSVADDPLPSFLNEERETDVNILTDGGASE